MKIDLLGRNALATESTTGIGFAIAMELAECGAEVVVNGRAWRMSIGPSSASATQMQTHRQGPLHGQAQWGAALHPIIRSAPWFDAISGAFRASDFSCWPERLASPVREWCALDLPV
jgi:NAD(P)-dependent dehydrogenase (short-subunit alcohol dehydrogenase family)